MSVLIDINSYKYNLFTCRSEKKTKMFFNTVIFVKDIKHQDHITVKHVDCKYKHYFMHLQVSKKEIRQSIHEQKKYNYNFCLDRVSFRVWHLHPLLMFSPSLRESCSSLRESCSSLRESCSPLLESWSLVY